MGKWLQDIMTGTKVKRKVQTKERISLTIVHATAVHYMHAALRVIDDSIHYAYYTTCTDSITTL